VAAGLIVYLLRVLDYGCASCAVLRITQHSTGRTPIVKRSHQIHNTGRTPIVKHFHQIHNTGRTPIVKHSQQIHNTGRTPIVKYSQQIHNKTCCHSSVLMQRIEPVSVLNVTLARKV